MKKTFNLGSIFTATLLAITGIGAWFEAENFNELGMIFPKTFSIILICCATGYIATAILKGETTSSSIEKRQMGRGFLVFIVLLLWCLTLKPLGFLLSSTLGYFSLIFLADTSSVITKKFISIHACLGFVIVCGMYTFFSTLLQVPLPKGILPF